MGWWIEFSEIARNFGVLVGGAFGLYLAWKRVTAANQQADAQIKQANVQILQAELERKNHVIELFNRAAGQLTDDKLEVRLAAILTLNQICEEFEDLSNPSLKLLTTFMTENAVEYGNVAMPPDVGEIVRIIQRRVKRKGK
jgi:hypothetical protein